MRNLFLIVLMLSFTGIVYAEKCRVKNSWGSYVYVDCERGGTYNAGPLMQGVEAMGRTANAPLPLDKKRARQMQREAAELEQYKAETERMKAQLERQRLEMERERMAVHPSGAAGQASMATEASGTAANARSASEAYKAVQAEAISQEIQYHAARHPITAPSGTAENIAQQQAFYEAMTGSNSPTVANLGRENLGRLKNSSETDYQGYVEENYSVGDNVRLSAGPIGMYSEPSDTSKRLGKLEKDTRLTVLGKSGEWLEVRTNSGTGWVMQDWVSKSSKSNKYSLSP